jgi:hypothetical protein
MLLARRRVRPSSYLLIFAAAAVALIAAHLPLLQLPYYWDETGQFIPAATDLYQTGALISHSATPNVHPPGVMAWLALAWHLFGFGILTTRVAMLMLAAFGVLATFLLAIELSRGSPGAPAFAAVALLCLCPLFYAQAMLAQLDMPAMAFTALALLLFLQNRFRAVALTCVALVMVKETGIIVPLVFAAWLLFERRSGELALDESAADILWFLAPCGTLLLWLIALRHFTGHWFGNSGFAEYNIFFPLNPVRLLFALSRRLYYLLIGSGHFIGTLIFLWAWKRMPLLRDRPWRIAATLVAAHVLVVTILGGAVLERYLLPVIPILYAAFAVSMGALSERSRKLAMGCLATCLVLANFINPPYPFPFENNLMFVRFVDIEREAAFAADTYDGAVATTFPMSAALAHPNNGYLMLPHKVIEVPDFKPSTVAALAQNPPPLMIVYNTETDPWHIRQTHAFQWFFGRYYNYERQLSAPEISQLLNMRIARTWESHDFSLSLLVNDEALGFHGFHR